MVRMPDRAGAAPRGLLIAAAVAAVMGVIGACVYTFVFRDPGAVRRKEGMHFECTACGQAFVKPPGELTTAELNTPPPALRVTCPKCGKSRAAIPTVQCPQCGKWFIPASYSQPAAKRAGRAKDVCPHCGTDRDRWYREYYRQKR